jgi:hypothetical protein
MDCGENGRSGLPSKSIAEGPAATEIHRRLRDSGLAIWQSHCVVDIINGHRKFVFKVGEFRRRSDNMIPGVINNLERRQGVVRVEWRGGSRTANNGPFRRAPLAHH